MKTLSPEAPGEATTGPDGNSQLGNLVIIVGPTAVGKTETAIALAEQYSGEIVSADSRLFYRGMDIGTAKPSLSERRRVAHHLIDVADPDEIWSLAVFQQQARQAIAGIHARSRLPFLVGGTGQYIRAVTEGWDIPKVEPDPALRQALEKWGHRVGSPGLHQRLAELDPLAAVKIDPQNVRRTVRALEVILTTGRLFSEQRQQAPAPYRRLVIGLNRPRPELYARIDSRVDEMFALGFIDEVRALLAKGYTPELPTLSAIGYREVIAYLQEKITFETAVMEIKRKTRIFVRRQANWFKPDDPEIHWFRMDKNIIQPVRSLIDGFLAGE